MAPTYSSTPKPSRPLWTEVVSCGRKSDPIEGGVPPPVTLSNRFTILADEGTVQPGDVPEIPAMTPGSAVSPPPAASDGAPAHPGHSSSG